MSKHAIGFCLTLVGTLLLGPLGLFAGIVAWVFIAKS